MSDVRLQEGIAVLRHALALADEHDLPTVALRARFNLAGFAIATDKFAEAVVQVDEALLLARERGDRTWETGLLSQQIAPLAVLGRWDECAAAAAPLLAQQPELNSVTAASFMATIASARDDQATLERCREIVAERQSSAHVDERIGILIVHLRDAVERGDMEEALSLARTALDVPTTGLESHEEVFGLAIEATLATGDGAPFDELIAYVDRRRPALATPVLRAGRARLQAEQAHRSGDSSAADAYEREAFRLLRSVGARPLLARALLERSRRRGEDEALAEARAILSDLDATRWLARIDEPSGLAA